jgi:valyl-tRNA synthetase
MNTEDILGEDIKLNPTEFAFPDKWIITKLNKLIDSVDSFFDNYEFGEAARLIYNFTWNDFASWYIEMSKISDSNTTKSVLVYVLNAILKLLHPYMPFVTEEIYQKLKTKDISIMVSDWPKNNELIYEEALEMEWFFELIKEIRTIRNDYQVSWTKPIDLFIQTNQKNSKFLIENDQFIKKFLNPEKLVISEEIQILEDVVSIILAEAQVYIPLGSLVDKNEEIKKLEEQSITLSNEISRCEKMLNNPNFISKAPQSKVEEEKQKLIKYQENYQEVISRLKELKR